MGWWCVYYYFLLFYYFIMLFFISPPPLWWWNDDVSITLPTILYQLSTKNNDCPLSADTSPRLLRTAWILVVHFLCSYGRPSPTLTHKVKAKKKTIEGAPQFFSKLCLLFFLPPSSPPTCPRPLLNLLVVSFSRSLFQYTQVRSTKISIFKAFPFLLLFVIAALKKH